MRADWITMVKTTVTEATFQQITPVSSVSCWAKQKSVVRSEFYAADANGRQVDAVFEASPIDYDGHQRLIHHTAGGDVEYKIVRDYQTGQDAIELVCTRITE